LRFRVYKEFLEQHPEEVKKVASQGVTSGKLGQVKSVGQSPDIGKVISLIEIC